MLDESSYKMDLSLKQLDAEADSKAFRQVSGALEIDDDTALRQAIVRARLYEIERKREAEIEELINDSLQEECQLVASHCLLDTPTGSDSSVDQLDLHETSPVSSPAGLVLRVNGMAGLMCEIKADRGWIVQQLKWKIATATQIPLDQQSLFVGAVELDDDTALTRVMPPSSNVVNVSFVRCDPQRRQWQQMVSIAGLQLAVAPPEVKADFKIALAAVRQHGHSLEYVADELRHNRELVLAAVQEHGTALEFAAHELQSDKEVVQVAVKSFGRALAFAAPQLQADLGIVRMAVSETSEAFNFASERIREDHEAVLEMVQLSGLALEFASPALRADREVVLAAVQNHGLALEYASEELRADRQVVLAAVKVDGLALWDAAEELRRDPELVAAARWR